MFKRIDHVEIIPTDINKTIDFYVSVLGFKIRERFPVSNAPMKEIAYLELGDTVIELISVDLAAAAPRKQWEYGYRALAVEVEDMDCAVSYLESKGVPTSWGPISLGKSKRAEIRDPDGFPIELRQW